MAFNLSEALGYDKVLSNLDNQEIEQIPLKYLRENDKNFFYEAAEKFERKCEWLYHCYISDEHRKKIKELLFFADEDYGWVKSAKKAIDRVAYNKLDWRTRNKLLAEFGNESEV